MLGASLSGLGLVIMAAYFVYQMQTTKKYLGIELLLGLLSAIALGFGTLFIMLSFGLYV